MQAGYLVVKMSSVSAGIIPDPLNLPLQTPKPVGLLTNTVPECPHNLSEGIHLRSQVIEAHIQVVSQVRGVVVMHPLGCRFGSVSGTRDMNTHAFKALIITFLLPLNPTCEAGDQCSQQGDCGRNEIRRCEDLPYRQDALYWLHGHSARVARSVLDGGSGDSLVGLLRVSEGGQDTGQDGGRGDTESALPVNVENSDAHNEGGEQGLGEGLHGAVEDARPE
nr:MAG TPA: hypothetical protein [Caudoviricetes sp.]